MLTSASDHGDPDAFSHRKPGLLKDTQKAFMYAGLLTNGEIRAQGNLHHPLGTVNIRESELYILRLTWVLTKPSHSLTFWQRESKSHWLAHPNG